jgi:hypothetical protein
MGAVNARNGAVFLLPNAGLYWNESRSLKKQIFATGDGLQEVMEARELINEAMELGERGNDRIARALPRVARRDHRLFDIDIRCCCSR